MITVLQFISTLSAALFAGAALYINVAEHPARVSLETRVAALQWAPSYKRATWLQAPLAMVSLLSGIGAWLQGGGFGWLVAALCIGAVMPFTFVVILPTNHELLAAGRDLSSMETRQLLVRWGRLHAIRTTLSFVATVIYLCLLIDTT